MRWPVKNSLQKRIRQNDRKLVVAYTLGLGIILGLSLVANFVIKEQVALQVSTLIRRMVTTGDYREVVYTLSSAKLDHFDAVIFQSKDDQRFFSIPANIDPNFFRQDIFINSLTKTFLPVPLYFGENRNESFGTIVFAFNRFSYFPVAFLLWLILAGLSVPFLISYRKKILQTFNEEIGIQNQLSKIEIGKKVRHDIRSPLAALQGVWSAADLDFETKKNLGLTIMRLEEVISDLEESSAKKEKLLVDEIYQIVTEVVEEKRLISGNEIEIQMHGRRNLFAKIVRSDLKRTLSNIVDNSIQAGSKIISIAVEKKETTVVVRIKDNGSGISSEHLAKVKEKGFTYGKIGGSGIGLFYANETMNRFHGSLDIQSNQHGTCVTLAMPLAKEPNWHTSQINLNSGDTVVLIDDQKTNRVFWELVFSDWIKVKKIKLISFSNPEDFKNWKVSQSTGKEIFLMDFDLGKNSENGLYLINLFGLKDRAFLVTGNYDDIEVQNGCEEVGCKLLPKGRIPEILVS